MCEFHIHQQTMPHVPIMLLPQNRGLESTASFVMMLLATLTFLDHLSEVGWPQLKGHRPLA